MITPWSDRHTPVRRSVVGTGLESSQWARVEVGRYGLGARACGGRVAVGTRRRLGTVEPQGDAHEVDFVVWNALVLYPRTMGERITRRERRCLLRRSPLFGTRLDESQGIGDGKLRDAVEFVASVKWILTMFSRAMELATAMAADPRFGPAHLGRVMRESHGRRCVGARPGRAIRRPGQPLYTACVLPDRLR